jgi:hypothetical protein
MKNNQNLTVRRSEQIKHFALIALAMAILVAFALSIGIAPALADGGEVEGEVALNQVLGVVVNIVKTAGTTIGAVIVIWGVFQIVLAFRREDSEGISKQITTVVVGTILVGFGIFIKDLLGALGVEIE